MTAVNAARTDLDAEVALRSVVRGARRPGKRRLFLLLAVDGLAAFTVAPLVSDPATPGHLDAVLAAAMLSGVWPLALLGHRAYDGQAAASVAAQLAGAGRSAATLAAIIPPACLLLGRPELIGRALVALAVAAAGSVVGRAALTVGLRAGQTGSGSRQSLVVGPVEPVMLLVAALRRDRRHDLQVVGACLVDPTVEPPLPALPVCGGIDDVCTVAIALGCDAVVVTPAAELDGAWLRRLGWSLHDAGIDLLLAPSLADVALTRIALTSAAGRPLLKVRAPVLTGPQRGVKSVFDLVAAALLVVLLAPVLVAIAVAVRLTSSGPALYRQRRVGRGGAEFTCLKFRTMDVDADIRRRELDHLNERREGPLFKIRHDPRITPLGAWLRRYSLDELPQLINVLGGSMSLVGPRPPLPAEASGYDDDVRRRLLVKPGLTGLWQVSGRAEIPWPEAVRLDLSYVDNWSPRLDARILLRTAGAVVRGTGAY